MGYLLLLLAIAVEVVATVALKLSAGFSRLWPSVVVVVGYTVSFALLSWVLRRGMPLSIAYALWSALGTAVVATIGVLLLDEPMRLVQAFGLGLIIAGVVLLHLGEAS